MDWLALGLATTVGIDAFAALLLGLAFARRTADREYLLGSLTAGGAALHGAAMIAASRLAPGGPLAAGALAPATLLLALCFAVHFAALYLGTRALPYVVATTYGSAAAVAGIELARLAAERTAHASEFGAVDLGARAPALAPEPFALHLLYVAAAASVLVLVAKAYLAGRPGALTIVVGATVLLATAIYDVGVASGAFATGYLADEGITVLLAAMALVPAARHAQSVSDLRTRTEELRARTHELRSSHEELRAAQEELDKKEQLAVVGELAAVIAHEVRNPLAIISNAVSGLRKPAIVREDREVLLSILDEETNRLNRLVTDLLRYARPVNLQRSQVALEDLLERALALAATSGSSIRMELEIETDQPHLWGDANLLRQVFDNLVGNAVQAMSGAGHLTVRVCAAVDAEVEGLAVDIIDTGEGMDTQVRLRALDPFFTTRPSGTGLGLAIVDRIVDAHAGHVSLRSRSGEGTTVTVFLPRGSPNDPPASPRSLARGASGASA